MFKILFGVFLFFALFLFYQIKHSSDKKKWKLHVLIGLCFFTSFVTMHLLAERIAVLLFFILFYLFSFDFLNKLKWKPLVFLGSISYPLYLLHMSIGYIIMNAVRDYVGFSAFVFICIPTIVMIAFAYLVHCFIEKPSNQYLRANKYLAFVFR